VEVTHSQNCCQLEAPERCWRVVVMRTGKVPEGDMEGWNEPATAM
jgi:hypothetical protein